MNKNEGNSIIGRTHYNDWMPPKQQNERRGITEEELRKAIRNTLFLHPDDEEDALDGIMSIIKANCWLKGGRRLPQFAPESEHYEEGYTQAQHDMLQVGWKSCKEWEK
mgnify:CR=1 FL=1